MKYFKYIIKSFVLLMCIFFNGCSFIDKEDISKIVPSNRDVHLNFDKLPVSPTWGVFINRRDMIRDISSLIQGSDDVVVGKVKSINSFVQTPFVYSAGDIDKITSWDMYSNSIVTQYEIEVTKNLKGNHQKGKTIKISYPTDNKYISYYIYQSPDKIVDVDREYLLFLSCCENKITDEEHCIITVSPFDSIYSVNGVEIDYKGFKQSNWLNGYNMISLERYIIDNRLNEATEKTYGQKVEEFYDLPENYMTALSDTSCYISEKQLVNTSDDIIIGEITRTEDFSDEIIDFSGKRIQHIGKIITVKVSDSIKGNHKAEENIEIFVREDEAKDRFLGGEYKKGYSGLFFLSCMDCLSSYHLLNGELQASIVFYNNEIYNRANFTNEAQSIGFINLMTDNFNSPIYKILFSDCLTKSEIVEKINNCSVELPNRITYGEYLELS